MSGLDEDGMVQDEVSVERKKMEQLEDMMSSLGTNPTTSLDLPRPGPEDLKAIHARLLNVARMLGLELDLD